MPALISRRVRTCRRIPMCPRVGGALLLLAGLFAPSARAVDGVLEINQACATGPGCFAGDAAGFPVTISSSGSYWLTGNLIVPDAGTTAISIPASGVSLDLNGFLIRGTSNFAGPPATSCTNAGTGIGVEATGSDVAVSNGHVSGMGSTGLSLGTNSRVERVSVEACCGNGVAIGIGSLAHETVVSHNFGSGIIAGTASRVSHCIASRNGASGVTSFAGASRLSVENCIATGNASDGIFGGQRSLVRGSVTSGNVDDGIALLDSGQVLESATISNGDRGITVLGTIPAGSSTAVGLTASNGNGGLSFVGGVLVGCNLFDLVPACPP